MSTIIGAETARLAGLQIDALQKLRVGQLTLDQLEWWLNLTSPDRTRLMVEPTEITSATAIPTPRTILARLYEGEDITLGETDGNETLAKAKKVFTGYLDPDFKNWKTDRTSGSTKAHAIAIYEMREDANFAGIFGSLGTDLDKLVMTQSQIIRFCTKHRDKLRIKDYATFFLFKVNTEKGSEYFVALVGVDGGGLEADVYRFGHDLVWDGGDRLRVVVPQL